MKKGLIFVLGILSFLGINTVSADTTTAISNYYDHFDEHVNNYNTYKENIDYMINYWKENYSNDYPYYYISSNLSQFDYSGGSPDFILMASDKNTFYYNSESSVFVLNGVHSIIGYDTNLNEYDTSNNYYSHLFYPNSVDSSMSVNNSHHTLISNGLVYDSDSNFLIPSYLSESLNLSIPEIELKKGFVFPTIISLYDDSYFLTNNYTTINLNDYSYVILSLKDYTPRDTFTTHMYVKGQLCPTTVYNYGSEEKKDYISGWQSPDCGLYYEEFTTHLNYIRKEDITNHAVYYLTGYDSSKPNLVKVDNSVYDITYITSENENNPSVSIGGKNYQTLPYSSLTDTAALTEKNGISNTWTCAKYDTDCIMDSSGIDIDNLFSSPLEILETIWDVITSTFKLVTEFISLLPQTLQAFLYLAFAVGIALGIIKIIL